LRRSVRQRIAQKDKRLTSYLRHCATNNEGHYYCILVALILAHRPIPPPRVWTVLSAVARSLLYPSNRVLGYTRILETDYPKSTVSTLAIMLHVLIGAIKAKTHSTSRPEKKNRPQNTMMFFFLIGMTYGIGAGIRNATLSRLHYIVHIASFFAWSVARLGRVCRWR